jgi:hypothetical protein
MAAIVVQGQPTARQPLLAREATGRMKASYKAGTGSRAGLMLNPEFEQAFRDAKARIREMQYRFVEETDENRQALHEIYCAIVLGTPYNDFGTH